MILFEAVLDDSFSAMVKNMNTQLTRTRLVYQRDLHIYNHSELEKIRMRSLRMSNKKKILIQEDVNSTFELSFYVDTEN